MAHGRRQHGVVAVRGGMLVVGGVPPGEDLEPPYDPIPPDELFDEASGRWFELPHPMVEPRQQTCVVSLPVAALTAPAAGAAAAAAP